MSKAWTILGWDAAWTETGSGAWSVIRYTGHRAQALLLEPTPKGWKGVQSRLRSILKDFSVDLVAIDMPIARTEVISYRESDRATTKAFSAYGCPVHSPTPDRPGVWGKNCLDELIHHGYTVGTQLPLEKGSVVEVYPHTALLEILRLSYRYPYKIGRAGSYWDEMTREDAQERVRLNMKRLFHHLAEEMDLLRVSLPFPPARPLQQWKVTEDQLDALICGWVGVRILDESFIPYGDDDSAIWNPKLKNLDPPKRGT